MTQFCCVTFRESLGVGDFTPDELEAALVRGGGGTPHCSTGIDD